MLTQSNKMFNLVLILSVLLFKNGICIEISSYARVSRNGGSISEKSITENNGNDPSSNYMSHIESTLIDKQNNVALKQKEEHEGEQQQQQQRTSDENVKEVEEKSEGRAIKSNYYFPLSDFLTKAKAMQSNSYKNEKEGRLIVYPSYTQNIDQTRRRYDMTPSTGQLAQRRFAPGEAYGVTGYKLKHPEKFPGYKYPQPSPSNPPPQPQQQPMMMMNPAPPPPSQTPMMLPTFPPMMPDSPPSQQYLPPSKFLFPIIVADTTTESEIVTVTKMKAPRATQPSHFLPTMPYTEDETTSMNPIIDLLSFNKKVNTSYMPPELQAIKDSIDSNHVTIDDSRNDIDADTVASADLHRFPPNINSIYQPATEMKRNNAINYKSRGSLEITTISNEDLHKFSSNADSAYLLPSNDVRNLEIINNRLPSPSGGKKNNIKSVDRPETSVPAIDLNKFPTNTKSVYPPSATRNFVNLYNSFLAQASGQENDIKPAIRQVPNDSSIDPTNLSGLPGNNNEKDVYVPPDDLNKFPPNSNSAYVPPDMTKPINLYSSYLEPPSGEPSNKSTIIPAEVTSVSPDDLFKFPPNSDAKYQPPVMTLMNMQNSYIPPVRTKGLSSVKIEESTVAPEDLNKFPPNENAAYLPPEMVKFMNLYNSYLPAASGEPKDTAISNPIMSEEESSVAPDDLNKFPPNLDSAYLPPEMLRIMNLYNSYLPPASGQDTENSSSQVSEQSEEGGVPQEDLHKFPPNLNAAYLPPEMMKLLNLYNSYLPPASGQETDTNNNIDQQAVTQSDDSSENNNMMYLPPKDLHNFPPNINSNYLPPEMMKYLSLVNSYLPPASGNDLGLSPPDSSIPSPPPYSMMNQQQTAANGGMQMNQGYIYNKPTGGDMMMPPSGMDIPPSGPPTDDHDHDHDHDHHHHHDHPWDSYPDIYYDDHDHHHHHHHVEETTTPEPAPAEPRVKKYSYYYLGRKLWYIPLYFTFWFCLYVAALIIRSIGRHKVDLPNHYVARSLHDMSHKEVVEKINKMTEFAMTQIEDFKNKYL